MGFMNIMGSTEEKFLTLQERDDRLKRKIQLLQKGKNNCTKSEKSELKDYKLIDNILYKTTIYNGEALDVYVVHIDAH